MRLIDADILEEFVWRERLDTRERIANLVERMPTVDPVKHGEWIVKDESYWRPHHSGDIQVNKVGLYCSECDKRLAKAQKYRNFCPNCGADMRGEQNE